MTYVQGFVEALGTIAFACWGMLRLARLDKSAEGELKWRTVPRRTVVSGCFLCSITVCLLCAEEGKGDTTAHIIWVRILLLGLLAAGLLAACVMDVETHLIYDYVWWISGAAALMLLVLSGNCRMVWRDVLCFVLLQQLFFGKMYGRADCHAFSVCAIAEGAFAMTMQDYLMHMLIAFCILAAVQLARGNLGRDGNLKGPVPFLPYIAVSFWSLFLAKFFLHIYAFRIAFSLVK